MKNTTATIKDVARKAGVSIATVSRILNGTGVVSPKLIENVQTTIKEIGYQPNAVARALKIKESKSIGLIIPDIENPFFPALVRGVEDTARKYDYAVILCNSDGYAEEEQRYIRFLHSKQVDGVIFTGSIDSDQNLALLAELNMPVVTLDRQSQLENISSVSVDNYYGATLAVEHLLDQGANKIAFLGGADRLSVAVERFQGYQDVLKKRGIPIVDDLILHGEFTFNSGYENTAILLKKQEKFDAVFAANDLIAFGVIDCLTKHGIEVPREIIVAGYDDIRMAGWYKPSLTTVRQPVYQMGEKTVEILLALFSKPESEIYTERFRPELIIRNSTKY
ncbi:MAG: transcriptional regulator, LacI family [Firmicutes bacterium]|nr:transcriptional regulator, LacI family [Bacillota bacterium]